MTKFSEDSKFKYGFKVRNRQYLVDVREVSTINPRVTFDLFSHVINDLLREIDDLKEKVTKLEIYSGLDDDR